MTSSKAIGFLGIGIFTLMILDGVNFLISSILTDVFIYIIPSPIWNYGINQYLSLLLIIILLLLLIRYVKRLNIDDSMIIKRTLIYFGLGFLLIQLLQFGLPFFKQVYLSGDYMTFLEQYYLGLQEFATQSQMYIDIPISVLKYTLIFWLTFREIR